MLAPTRDLVAELNARARADRLARLDGQPGPRGARWPTASAASAGDMIITRRNDRAAAHQRHRLGEERRPVDRHHRPPRRRAGGRATTTPAGTHHPARRLRRASTSQLGYATTVHGAQGITADTCHTVATGAGVPPAALRRADPRPRTPTTSTWSPPATATRTPSSPPTRCSRRPPIDILDRDPAPATRPSVSATSPPASSPTRPPTLPRPPPATTTRSASPPSSILGADAAGRHRHRRRAPARPGSPTAPPTPPCARHLALLAVDGHDPVAALTAAVDRRGNSTPPLDPAAVLDWRLDPTGDATPARGPLPWLPAIPAALRDRPAVGRLPHRPRRPRRAPSPPQVADQAARLDPDHRARLGRPAARPRPRRPASPTWPSGAPPPASPADDRRPTGAAAAGRRRRAAPDRPRPAAPTRVLGDPHQAADRWAPLADRLDPRITADPYWPAWPTGSPPLDRAGIDIAALLTAGRRRARRCPTSTPPPRCGGACRRHLSPAALTATDRLRRRHPAPGLDPDPDRHRSAPAGADRVLADPAWPALVAAVTTAARARLDRRATSCAPPPNSPTADTPTDRPLRTAELATALVWRIAMLTDPDAARRRRRRPRRPAGRRVDPPEDPTPRPRHRAISPASPTPPPAARDRRRRTASHRSPAATQPCQADARARAAHSSRPRRSRGRRDAAHQVPPPPRRSRATAARTQPAGRRLLRRPLPELVGRRTTCASGSAPTSTDDRRFTPGYAPAGWTALTDHLRRRGATDDEILAAGLARSRLHRAAHRPLPRPARLPHPRPPTAQIHGFIGRRNPATPDDDHAGPKYLNTAETDLFTKGAQLFGLPKAAPRSPPAPPRSWSKAPSTPSPSPSPATARHVGVAPLGTAFTDAKPTSSCPTSAPAGPASSSPPTPTAPASTPPNAPTGSSPPAATTPPTSILHRRLRPRPTARTPRPHRRCAPHSSDTQPLAATLIDDRLAARSATATPPPRPSSPPPAPSPKSSARSRPSTGPSTSTTSRAGSTPHPAPSTSPSSTPARLDQRPAHPRRSAHLPGHPAARPRDRAHHGGANAGA